MRMLAWVNLLNPRGGWAASALDAVGAKQAFQWIGLSTGGGSWFGQPITVIMGLVYGYIPFFILPLYANLDRIDPRYLEAARDLGASSKRDVPAGHAAAVGARDPRRVGHHRAADVRRLLHEHHPLRARRGRTWSATRSSSTSRGSQEPQKGAVLVLVLSALLLVLMAYYLVTTARAQKQAANG